MAPGVACRDWGEEVVVHLEAGRQTHVLAGAAAALVGALVDLGRPVALDKLAASFAADAGPHEGALPVLGAAVPDSAAPAAVIGEDGDPADLLVAVAQRLLQLGVLQQLD